MPQSRCCLAAHDSARLPQSRTPRITSAVQEGQGLRFRGYPFLTRETAAATSKFQVAGT